MVGNGVCNDETNYALCNYDGGDCCGENVSTNNCTICRCHLQETCIAGFHPLAGNGFCNDEINIAGCYDGGDCCGYETHSEHCTEETCIVGTHPLIGDGFCNDEMNNENCNYDGGDCCVNINTHYCSECNCLGGGVITLPALPLHYMESIDLTWLIQVPFGLQIKMDFPYFKIMYRYDTLSFFSSKE